MKFKAWNKESIAYVDRYFEVSNNNLERLIRKKRNEEK